MLARDVKGMMDDALSFTMFASHVGIGPVRNEQTAKVVNQ